ncbi:MAG: DUF167 domain-containing protein [Candidatus Omnitrophica bacterium]|nr:DUF167 domain-containing protein [Candidatus Omnitrophota bacterium]MDD5352892.1 DUF167 domain-containing protein [Candidatus Omnitrophota bacterium]MDD5550491.1 DUF167 domain-containing protein [Candidatus Omnitrophota bacterium]
MNKTTIINIKVIPKAKKNLVKETKNGLRVYVTSPAEKGKANVAFVNLLSKFLNVKKYDINIISGQHSRDKVIEIPNR